MWQNLQKTTVYVGVKPRIAIPEPCSYDLEYSGRALPPYLRAIEAAGGEPVVDPVTEFAGGDCADSSRHVRQSCCPEARQTLIRRSSTLQTHPKTAPADPPRDAADELLLQDAYNLRKPVFGICYGLQSFNVWRTGSLMQHIESKVNHSAGAKVEVAHKVAGCAGFAAGKRDSSRTGDAARGGKFQPSSVGRCCGRRPACRRALC